MLLQRRLDGARYDLRAVATDNAGNVTNSATVANRVVDNTAPTATDIQTGVTGATAAKPEQGDTLIFTFSEQIQPTTIVAGWNGTGTQTVTVTMDTGNHLTIAGATLVNGFITLGGANYIQATKTVIFSNSTISQSGSTVTLTLGTPDKPDVKTVLTCARLATTFPPFAFTRAPKSAGIALFMTNMWRPAIGVTSRLCMVSL